MTECAIIRDLLPLYVDDVLSEESKTLVSEHLVSCEKCRQEFSKMQSNEIKVTHHDKDSAKIGVLKSMKKKLFRKNVMVSLGSIVVLIALALGIYNWVILPQTPIPYETGLLSVEVNTTSLAYDASGRPIVITEPDSTNTPFEERAVLDIVSTRNAASRDASQVDVEENGESIRLVFVNFTENLLAKWEPDIEVGYRRRIVEPVEFDRIEVYYVDEKLSEINVQNDYAQLRADGALIWSGTLDSE